MQNHSLPFKGQTSNAARPSNLSFIVRHKNITFLAALTFVLILLGLWQHKAAMVGDHTNIAPTTSAPRPPAAAPFVTSDLPNITAPQTSASGEQSTSTQLNINNQPIAVPKNGSVHTAVPNVNGNSSVDFSTESHSEGSGNATSESSTSIQIHSNGQSEIDVMNSE